MALTVIDHGCLAESKRDRRPYSTVTVFATLRGWPAFAEAKAASASRRQVDVGALVH